MPFVISQSDDRQKNKTVHRRRNNEALLDVTSREADALTHHRDFGNLSKLSYAKAGKHLEVILFEYSRHRTHWTDSTNLAFRKKPVLPAGAELATAQTRAAADRNFAVDDPRGIS